MCVCTVKMPPRSTATSPFPLLYRQQQNMRIIVILILHSICVLNYAKVYVKQNIFHKKSKYMIFHVLLMILEKKNTILNARRVYLTSRPAADMSDTYLFVGFQLR